MFELISRVTIMAVGVGNYADPQLRTLRGPEHDIKNLRTLLVENPATALFESSQFIEVLDPTSDELRQYINQYLIERTAEQDILVFYFSGHGVSIGRDDFGFCTLDTIIHPISRLTLPMSVMKLGELLKSLTVQNVIPVLIIDACYSGVAGRALRVTPAEATTTMQQNLDSVAASSYALLCSCSEDEAAIDTVTGGVFSRFLTEIGAEGLSMNESNGRFLTLPGIFQKLNGKLASEATDMTPKLYLGQTLPEFPIMLNIQFRPRRYSLSPTYISILKALWNNGQERNLLPDEIGKLCGNGAYCNHNKLSFPPWALVETIAGTKLRRLTERGRQFIQDAIQVPKTLVDDPKSHEPVPAPGTYLVSNRDFSQPR